jgi:hypothetical protein
VDVANIIQLLRRRITEVDPGTSVYSDPDLTQCIKNAVVVLKTFKVQGFASATPFVVALQPPGITPEPTDEQGVIIAYRSAVDILTDEYQKRLKEGTLGVSWQSGLESESSITAAKSYQERIADLTQELDSMILIQGAQFTAFRAQ